jgi:putative transposase
VAFQQLLANQGIACSTSRAGNAPGIAAVDRFFSSLRTERFSRKVYSIPDGAHIDLLDRIERFYSPSFRRSAMRVR